MLVFRLGLLRISRPEKAAEVTNRPLSNVVLTPGIVGALPELEMAGFTYEKL